MRQKQRVFSLFLLSPSSRRAWIEIIKSQKWKQAEHVALLAEGVDRNLYLRRTTTEFDASPSSRRAWIEIALR